MMYSTIQKTRHSHRGSASEILSFPLALFPSNAHVHSRFFRIESIEIHSNVDVIRPSGRSLLLLIMGNQSLSGLPVMQKKKRVVLIIAIKAANVWVIAVYKRKR